MSAIACKGINKSFGTSRVLSDLDLEIPDGAIVSVLGQSGSGKTTLLRVIAGFEQPDSGTVALDGDVVDGPSRFVPPDKRRIGFVAQEGNLFPHLTVARNVGFGLSRADRASGRVEEMLGLVGLADLGSRYPHQLSGGQQQRVAIARALAPKPRLVLLDEPFSSLDAGLRSSLRAEVMQILRSQHATTIFVTHDQSEALSVADLAGVMISGRIHQFAHPSTLYDQPADLDVARFLGEANLLAGTASHRVVSTALGTMTLTEGTPDIDGPATVLIRPEQITLLHDPAANNGAVGQVVHTEYYGHDCVVVVRLPGGNGVPVRVRCPGKTPVDIGDTVSISAAGETVAWTAGRLSGPPSGE